MALTPLRSARPNGGGDDGSRSAGAAEGDDFSAHFDDLDRSLNEALEGALDVAGWTAGDRMADLEERLEREVEMAMANEAEMAPRVIEVIEKNIGAARDASRESGIYTVMPDEITSACR